MGQIFWFSKKNSGRAAACLFTSAELQGEIKCLRIIKRLNLDNGPQGKKSANGQICNIGGGRGKLVRFGGGRVN